MSKKKVRCLTFTILTESPVALSNDQGFGNYTPIKKYFYKNGQHAMTSVATFTYELKKKLVEDYNWQLSDIVLKKSKSKSKSDNESEESKITSSHIRAIDIEKASEKKFEADVFGYLIPGAEMSKTSPLRIIPFISLNRFKNDTQLITNRGNFDISLKRKYYDDSDNEVPITDIPRTQALANEEVFGDYYAYTITLELDRIGVNEVNNGKLLLPENRTFIEKDLRLQIVRDLIDAVANLTRDIKHQKVLLKPLAVFGGAFENVVPYFWNDIEFINGKLNLSLIKNTIESYSLEKDRLLLSVNEKIFKYGDLSVLNLPPKDMVNLTKKLYIDKDNKWYLGDD